MNRPEWLLDEPAEFYHEQSKSGKYMSSHLLSDFRNSPLLYHKKVLGQVEEKDSSAYFLGTAAHKLILEGKNAFDAEYEISDGPVNEKTGEPYGKTTKAFQTWYAMQEKEIISTADYGTIAKFHHSVWAHPEANKLLSSGFAEGVVRASIEDVPCQIRMDWFNPEYGLVDLKTCAELKYFESDCRRFGYVLQLAFYREVLQKATSKELPVYIIAVEKCEPFACGVWRITPEVLDEANAVNRAALRRYKQSHENNLWPTGYETLRIIDNF
jgi:hypothetical protein